MIPLPADEILALFGMMILRLGLPLLLVMLLGTLAQRVELMQP